MSVHRIQLRQLPETHVVAGLAYSQRRIESIDPATGFLTSITNKTPQSDSHWPWLATLSLRANLLPIAMTTCPHTLSQCIFALPSRTAQAVLLPGCRLTPLSEHSTNQMPESTATIFCCWQIFPVGTYSRLIAVLCSLPRSRHRPLAVARPREAAPTTSLNINGHCPKRGTACQWLATAFDPCR